MASAARGWGRLQRGVGTELDFKGKVEIDQVEKRGRAHSRLQEHKGRQQDMKGLDRVSSSKSLGWPDQVEEDDPRKLVGETELLSYGISEPAVICHGRFFEKEVTSDLYFKTIHSGSSIIE